MTPFTHIEGIAVPMPVADIDTGMLAHSQWCRDHPDDLAGGLFRDWRVDAQGREHEDFVLNQPRYRKGRIIVAGPNFGCGSSRETAVWALMAYGIRCVVAPSFGDIFRDNAFQNGLLPIAKSWDIVQDMVRIIEAAPDPVVGVDLQDQRITLPDGRTIGFDIAANRRVALLEGLDETLLIRRSEDAIRAFEEKDRLSRPWIYERAAHV